jgi:xanthine dehydrogenase YagR molybdenum-binding subunit
MAATSTRLQKHPVGIDSIGLGEIEREVAADEPPPLPRNSQLSHIGMPVPRIDGRAKVTGAARFTVDVKLPGMLHGRLLRSPHPHARIAAIDTGTAARHPGVRAIHLITEPVGRAVEAADADAGGAGRNRRAALYVGDAIAAVAATTPEVTQTALNLIEVDYVPLPFVVDIEDARRDEAPLVFTSPVHGESFAGGAMSVGELPQRGNVRGPNAAGSRGDAAQGLAQADVVVEGEFRTQMQTHCCMETHAVVADWRADGLTVYMSTQYTAGVRNGQPRRDAGVPG